jgi:heptosyltransferase-2
MPKRILIRGVNWLGDAVMSAPAVQAIRHHCPEAEIALLSQSKLADLWLHHPGINTVLSFSPSETVLAVAKKIAVYRPELVFVFPNSTRSAMEPWLARSPKRIGYGGRMRSIFLSQTVARKPRPRMRKRSVQEIESLARTAQPRAAYPPEAHHAFDYLDLVESVFGPSPFQNPLLHVAPSEITAARERFSIPLGKPVIGINPGAEYGPAKRWPLERFIAAALEIQRRLDCRWILFGGKADQSLADEIESALIQKGAGTVFNLSGKTTLRELCAGLKLCGVVIANDTGPMHVAAALGVPVVVPFGSTSPELTGPGTPGSMAAGIVLGQAPCAPCFRRECPIDFRCMRSISVEEIVARTFDALT